MKGDPPFVLRGAEDDTAGQDEPKRPVGEKRRFPPMFFCIMNSLEDCEVKDEEADETGNHEDGCTCRGGRG